MIVKSTAEYLMLESIIKLSMIAVLITGCAANTMERAAEQLAEAERFSDEHASGLYALKVVYSDMVIYD